MRFFGLDFVTEKSLNILQIFNWGIFFNARRQCYDKAAIIPGKKYSVTAKIKALNGKCLYCHCQGHDY